MDMLENLTEIQELDLKAAVERAFVDERRLTGRYSVVFGGETYDSPKDLLVAARRAYVRDGELPNLRYGP